MADQGLDLATYLAELEQQRASLDIQIAGVKARLGMPVEAPPAAGGLSLSGALSTTVRDASPPGRFRPDEFFGMSIPEAIRAYLAIMKQPQGPKAIMDGLTAGGLLTNAKFFYANVTTALKRLRSAGHVVLTPNGWGLTVWYPNRPKVADEPKKGRGGRRKRAKPAAKKVPPPEKSQLKLLTPPTNGHAAKPTNSYREFIGEAMKAGKTMAEAAEAWRNRGAGGS